MVQIQTNITIAFCFHINLNFIFLIFNS